MPWPVRVNPHLEEARAHALAWARDMGMLSSPQSADGSSIGDESMDVTLLVALTHPDAPPSELELLSDWYVWGWYVENSSTAFDGLDIAGGREHISRLLAFMPVDITAPPPGEPANPLERGLADLWPRTAPTKSAEWRHRFSEHIQSLAEEALREHFNLAQDHSRVLDPIEYIDMRRQVGGSLWSADLVEHALGVEIPPELYRSRPIRVLNETFADSVSLRHDIIFYEEDVDKGKVNNGVVVVKSFLDCDPQRAVDIVNNFVTSRLYQFEDTTVTELFPLFEELETGLLTRAEIFTYVKGLRDWMAGDLEWSVRSGDCYSEASTVNSLMLPGLPCGPTGLGTAVARLGLSPAAMGLRLRSYQGVPYRAEPFELPQLYMPFTARLNPHLEALRTHAKAWAREMGLLGPIPDARGKWGRWDEDRWESARFPLFSALAFPDPELAELKLVNDWCVWAFYVKDYFLECYKRRRDLLGARAFLSRLPTFAPAEGTGTAVPTNPAERALADLWSRSVEVMSADLRRPLAGCIEDLAEALLRELTTLVQNRAPDPLDFEEMRPPITFSSVVQLLVLYAFGLENSPEIYQTSPLRSLVKAFQTVMSAYIEIFAYEKRVDFEHDFNSGVVLIQRFFDCDVQQAVDILSGLGASRLRQFEYTVATELPALFEELNLDTSAREGVLTYVEGLQVYMAGVLAWVVGGSSPYTKTASPDVPATPRLSMVPTGLGTSAARISSLSGVGSPEPVAGG